MGYLLMLKIYCRLMIAVLLFSSIVRPMFGLQVLFRLWWFRRIPVFLKYYFKSRELLSN